MFTSKICIVGDFGVGKTSTVERFVNSQFSEKYLTTVGVKVDTKSVTSDGYEHKLVVWDVAGTNKFGELEFSYLRGAAGYILVADGTRRNTVENAKSLLAQIESRYGSVVPIVFLVNKSDVQPEWEVTAADIEQLGENYGPLFLTSAKTGDHVDTAFSVLTSLIIKQNLDGG